MSPMPTHRVRADAPALAAADPSRAATALALFWLVVAAFVYLAPALLHGTKLGSYDLLTHFGLGTVPGAQIFNVASSDQIQQDAPWTALAWQQVHHGQLPLWDPYNGLGLPLAFNFQSAPFSLPMAISYLLPLRFAYTTVVIMKILIAGTGAFVFSRVLGLRLLAATFAATIVELCGAFTAWLGWAQDGVFCWLGWLLACVVLVVRGKRPVRDTVLLALVVALSILGGFPEATAITFVAGGVFVAVVVAVRAFQQGQASHVVASLVRVVVGSVCGIALSAPLLLPGLQVVKQSVRDSNRNYVGIPLRAAVNLVFSGFFGYPISTSQSFGPDRYGYYETAAFVGVIALVLIVVAILRRWREPEVAGLALVAVVLALLIYHSPLTRVLDSIPLFNVVEWNRALVPFDFVLAMLAGFGLQTVLDNGQERGTRRCLLGALTVSAVGILVLRLHGSGALSRAEAAIRSRSFLWPAIELVAGAAAVAVLLIGHRGRAPGAHEHRTGSRSYRARRTAAVLLVAAEAAFLLAATPNLWSSSKVAFPVTAGDSELERLVGQARVGFGICPSLSSQPNLGILAEANSAYGVAEISAYNSVVPRSWHTAWTAATGLPYVAKGELGAFCPSLPSASLARNFGVSYLLEPPHHAAASGTVYVATIDGEGLYRVPGGGLVTMQPTTAAASDDPDVVVPTEAADPSSIHFVVDPRQPSTLHIHITDLPGWKATVDGRPLALHSWGSAMLEASVPAGQETIVLTYWPHAFTDGLVVAGATALGLAMALLVSWRRRLRRGEAGRRRRKQERTSAAAVPAERTDPAVVVQTVE